MPGAPNRPPEAAAPPPPPPAGDPPALKLIRRLVPSHVALLLDTWKGAVPAEVAGPYEKADAAYRSGDLTTAASALDQLSIRFAEPRWPSLPEPFQKLRVAIPAPVPPHWDPDHGLAPAEKEARQARRSAGDQLALAEASVRWALAHGVPAGTLESALASGRSALTSDAPLGEFYAAIDGVWRALDSTLPPLKRGVRAPSAAAAGDDA